MQRDENIVASSAKSLQMLLKYQRKSSRRIYECQERQRDLSLFKYYKRNFTLLSCRQDALSKLLFIIQRSYKLNNSSKTFLTDE